MPNRCLGWRLAAWLAGFCVVTPAVLLGAAGVVSSPPANVTLRPVVSPEVTGQPPPPTYELALKWNDRATAVLTVPLKNDDEKPLKILGVQATRGIFIVDFPGTVPSKKEEKLSFIYSAADNTDGDTDLIRLLTDQGLKEIVLKLAREEVVRFDAKELAWAAGAPAEAKAITLTVAAGTAVPVRARATGGNQAVLEPVNATTWRVKVTPASTAKSGSFPIFLDFDQPLPGRAPVILGVIQPKE